MKVRAVLLGVVMTALCGWSAWSQSQRTARHPDEPASYTYDERFSFANALSTTNRIGGYLKSFRALTQLAKAKVSKSDLAKVGNTEPDVQDLGFTNSIGVIEGTLRKQRYQLARLELQLARMQREEGKITRKSAAAKEAAFRVAEKEFQRFWHAFGVAD